MPAFSWLTAANGLWSNASAWNPAGIPGAAGGDTAQINVTGASYTVTYDEISRSINGLTVNSTDAVLSFNANTALTVFGSTLIQAGTVQLLNGGGVLAAGALTVSSGALLELGAGASVTYNSAIISGGVRLSGTNSFGTASQSLSLGGIIEVTAGIGTIGFASISGSGVLEADGGELLVTGSMANSSVIARIADSAASRFETTGPLFFGSSMSIDFVGAQGEFEYDNPANNQSITFNITGLNAGASAVTPTNFISLAGVAVTITGGGTGLGATGNIVLSNGNTLSLSGIKNVGVDGWEAFATSDGAGGTDIFLHAVCYGEGTGILTPAGERSIETLQPGEFVLTWSESGLSPHPVKWVGRRRINIAAHPNPDAVAPVLIRRGAFADGVPRRDLLVSPAHAILVDGKLIPAKMLVNDMTITRETQRSAVTYYHVELERHAIILANNLRAESYLDTGNRSFFRNAPVAALNAGEYHVNDASEIWEQHACAPLTVAPNDVRPHWEVLTARAEGLGYRRPMVETTTDADLHVMVNGRRMNAVNVSNRTYRFILPAGTDAARLVSRATAPAALAAYTGDPRSLGVSIRSIMVKSGASVDVFPADHPALRDGWHTVERLGSAIWRWSDGDADLPVAASPQPVVLEIQIADTATYAIGQHDATVMQIAA